MKFEEIEKLLNERKETELKLREQVDKKIKMLIDSGYSRDQAYRMLVDPVVGNFKVVDYRTLMRWHTGETMRPHTIDKLNSLIEEEEK